MVSENPTMVDLLPDPVTSPRDRLDPVRVAVQVALVLYLLPVILLVATIGVTAIVVGRLARMTAKAADTLKFGPDRHSLPGSRTDGTVIGTRPIARWKRKPSRVIR
jgi:hypothetical protein